MRVMSLGEAERQSGAAQGPLPGAHEVEVRGESHLEPLFEHDAKTRTGLNPGRGGDPAARTAAERRCGDRGPRALEIERCVRLLDPRTLRTLREPAREADVLETAVVGDCGLVSAARVAH